jgi:mRNA interferase MazF
MFEIKIINLIDIRYYGDRGFTVSGLRQCDINRKKLRRHIYMCNKIIKRGDIFNCDLSPVVGSEQGGIRPVIVIQNDVGNLHSKTVVVAAITSKTEKFKISTHIYINNTKCGLEKESLALLEQIRTVDRSRLSGYRGSLSPTEMIMINKALLISIGLADYE